MTLHIFNAYININYELQVIKVINQILSIKMCKILDKVRTLAAMAICVLPFNAYSQGLDVNIVSEGIDKVGESIKSVGSKFLTVVLTIVTIYGVVCLVGCFLNWGKDPNAAKSMLKQLGGCLIAIAIISFIKGKL